MSVPFLRKAASAGQNDKLVRFVRPRQRDESEEVRAGISISPGRKPSRLFCATTQWM
jgi:hypothetical protein